MAQVKGHELTSRGELLPEVADHSRARKEYYKILIGALEKLPKPVRAEKWKRLTLLYTTGEYLLSAGTLNDLVVRSDERALLWQSLQERAQQSQYQTKDLPQSEVDPSVLFLLLGIKEPSGEYDPTEFD